MKKKERKEFAEYLLIEIKKLLQENKTELANNTKKATKKSVKQIVKKTSDKKAGVLKKIKKLV